MFSVVDEEQEAKDQAKFDADKSKKEVKNKKAAADKNDKDITKGNERKGRGRKL